MDAEPGSLPRASTGTAVMIHAPAALGSGQRRELRPRGREVALPWNHHQGSQPDPDSAGPLRTQAASRPPPGSERLALQSGGGPRADRCCARVCAPACACACARGRLGGSCLRKSRFLELTAQAIQHSTPSRRPQSALEGAPSPCARASRHRPGLLPGAARAGSPRRQRAPAPGPAPPGPAALACPPGRPRPPAPRPARPPRCATLPKLEAEAGRLHSRRAHGGGGGGGGEGGGGGGGGGGCSAAKTSEAGEAEPARPNADRGGRPRPEQREKDARRRRRPARESKVGARGCARALGPGGAAARAPVRPALAGRMGGGAPGPPPPPPAACAPVGRRGRGAARARPLGRRITPGSRPGRSP
ncbi:translation initiation factor IF-2-like [Canis lupus dingo]|uniref:translation initiation factor IF-2-like n=1 Tax=Canis lupus dingo TaxID=286419 RepID=UPI0020C4E48A|nr:translation initiation factor IF-2-like [Canis lupus dingo]